MFLTTYAGSEELDVSSGESVPDNQEEDDEESEVSDPDEEQPAGEAAGGQSQVNPAPYAMLEPDTA